MGAKINFSVLHSSGGPEGKHGTPLSGISKFQLTNSQRYSSNIPWSTRKMLWDTGEAYNSIIPALFPVKFTWDIWGCFHFAVCLWNDLHIYRFFQIMGDKFVQNLIEQEYHNDPIFCCIMVLQGIPEVNFMEQEMACGFSECSLALKSRNCLGRRKLLVDFCGS